MDALHVRNEASRVIPEHIDGEEDVLLKTVLSVRAEGHIELLLRVSDHKWPSVDTFLLCLSATHNFPDFILSKF